MSAKSTRDCDRYDDPVDALREARKAPLDLSEWSMTKANEFVSGGSILLHNTYGFDVGRVGRLAPDTIICNVSWDRRGDRIPDRHAETITVDLNEERLWRRPFSLTNHLAAVADRPGCAHLNQVREEDGAGRLMGLIHPYQGNNQSCYEGDCSLITAAPRIFGFLRYGLHLSERAVTFSNSGVSAPHDPLVTEAMELRDSFRLPDLTSTPGPWTVNGGFIGLAGHDDRSVKGTSSCRPISTELNDAVAIIGVPNEQAHSDTRLARLVAAAPMLSYALDVYIAHRTGQAIGDPFLPNVPTHDQAVSVLVDAYHYAKSGGRDLAEQYRHCALGLI